MTSRLQQLTDQGVAVWVDSIARDWIQKGELRRLRDQFQVVGVTSNPTIFQKAMGEGSFYDDDIGRLADQGLDARRIFESLALDDIRAAAADMETAWEHTGGLDGRISFEVPPDIADDTEATIRETRRLFDALARPNVFIKIPATAAGVPAIRASVAAGINVNVTLIFSIQRYREVIEAYLGGLEELAEAGGDLTEVASVASFFVSRVDTMVDQELQALADKGGPEAEAARARLGTAAIDNAKLAYVEELVARDTVNTMPIETIEAFADHGEVRGQTATEDLDRAHRLWSDLAALGIDEDDIGDRLEREGVEKFEDSYNAAVETIEAKRQKLMRR
jgi:transaldolase